MPAGLMERWICRRGAVQSLMGHPCTSLTLYAPRVQGLNHLGLRPEQVSMLLAHAANMAALYSLFVGQLPPATRAQAAEWLAQAGLLGRLIEPGAEHDAQPDVAPGGTGQDDITHTMAPQMRLYNSHVLAGEEANEDFEGNFS
jgi:hypothetical protein